MSSIGIGPLSIAQRLLSILSLSDESVFNYKAVFNYNNLAIFFHSLEFLVKLGTAPPVYMLQLAKRCD